MESGLIPASCEAEAVAKFLHLFRDLPDSLVSARFRYGELRLSRLNLYAPFLLNRMEYFDVSRQYEKYFSRYCQILLFVFATFSVVLGAMQVAVAVVALPYNAVSGPWAAFYLICE